MLSRISEEKKLCIYFLNVYANLVILVELDDKASSEAVILDVLGRSCDQ